MGSKREAWGSGRPVRGLEGQLGGLESQLGGLEGYGDKKKRKNEKMRKQRLTIAAVPRYTKDS